MKQTCQNCKNCTDYNYFYRCYQCKLDYSQVKLDDTCERWEYYG